MTAPAPTHVPVMFDEVMEALRLRPGMVAVDGTLGLAGHAREIARRIAPGGKLIAFDWDDRMMAIARERLADAEGCDVLYIHDDYRAIPEVLKNQPEPGADAIFIDMGLNNAQIEDPEYGISFLREGPLDMRLDKRRETTAADWLNHATAKEIEDVLFVEGGERWARRIAATIVERRKTKPLATTTDLVDCVMAAIPAAKRDPRIHPATRTFQGVRIFINDELEDLGECVTAIAQSLRPGGTMVVLAYHSGEDGAVKHAFHALARTDEFSEPHRKPARPSEAEVARNPKARSVRLRTLVRQPKSKAKAPKGAA